MKVLTCLLFVFCATVVAEETHTTEPLTEIKKAVDAGKAVIVDVREKDEWDDGHVKGAVLLPMSELKKSDKAAASLPKDKPLYVHCAVGARALNAAKMLKKQGYDARALKDNVESFEKSGFKTEK